MFRNLLTPTNAKTIACLYADDRHFRSHVVMARHGFGRGEYKYFCYPLPDIVARCAVRCTRYWRLSLIGGTIYGYRCALPGHARRFHQALSQAGQTRPTPLLLQYAEGDYNAAPSDLYGEHVFPLQVAILLSEPERDFTGGEFV